MDLGLSEIRELIDLLNQSNLSELTVEAGDVKISLKKGGTVAIAPPIQIAAPAPQPAPQSNATASSADAREDDGKLYLIKAPMVGTFYRSSSPDAPPFAEVGQIVETGQTVCIIEAMKLMNEIEAESGGKVVRILVGNGEPIEFGQVLFEIER